MSSLVMPSGFMDMGAADIEYDGGFNYATLFSGLILGGGLVTAVTTMTWLVAQIPPWQGVSLICIGLASMAAGQIGTVVTEA